MTDKYVAVNVPMWLLEMINQIHEIERKNNASGAETTIARNIARMLSILEDGINFMPKGECVRIHCLVPLNERYDATRTDCEAIIEGNVAVDASDAVELYIREVVKPIVHYSLVKEASEESALETRPISSRMLLQRGVVIVGHRNKEA